MKRARATLGQLKRIAVAGVFGTVLAVAGGLATPAPAEAATLTGLLKNAQTKRCLDANFEGNVYIRPCQLGNQYQTWDIVSAATWASEKAPDGSSRFQISNRATGQCLSIVSNNPPHGGLATKKCTSVFFDYEHTAIDAVGSSFNNVKLRGQTRTQNQPFCIGGNNDQAYAQICNGSASQTWARVTRG